MSIISTSGVSASTPAAQEQRALLAEQSISATFHVEVMHDLENGEPTLVASAQPNQGDLQVVTADQVRAKAAEIHSAVDRGIALAASFEAAITPRSGEQAKQWTFTNSETGLPLSVTCMPGCTMNHERDAATPAHPVDVYCWTDASDDVHLPIDTNGDPEEYRVLSTRIEVHPFATALAHRLPFAVVEVIDDHWIAGLDPDALETVINTLAKQLTQMRRTHAELVRTRAEYLARQTPGGRS